MPRKPGIPKLTRHKASGRGVVRLSGHDHYLGDWPVGEPEPPPEVRSAYDRTIAEWLATGRRQPRGEAAPSPVNAGAGGACSVAELILAFYRHAQEHYRRGDGRQTNEVAEYRRALALLREMYGEQDVSEFGPLKLKALRERMAQQELCRGVINQRVGRVVRVFKWGVGEELVPEPVWRALTAVRGLQKGRTQVRESEPVKLVPAGVVERTLPHCTSSVQGALRFMLHTGCRPGEALHLHLGSLDRSSGVWLYRPQQHKTRHRDKDRVVAVGPKAQAVVLEFVRIRCPLCGIEGRPSRIGSRDGALCGPCADRMDEGGVFGPWQRVEAQPADAVLFSPALAMAERSADRRARRKTRVHPSQQHRKKASPKQTPGERYSVESLNRAIAKACKAAGVEPWHPNQLRHAHATAVRKAFGLEAAQVVLGHSKADVTQVYAEKNVALAVEVARAIG